MALAALLPMLPSNQCPVSPDTCISSPIAKMGQTSATIALFLASGQYAPSQAFISNISVGPSSEWYFSLTPFESIMLGILVLKLMLLRYVTILPVNINNLANKNNFGFDLVNKRRKRNVKDLDDFTLLKEKERLAEIMFTVIRRLDMQDCFLRLLCEVQVHSLRGRTLPREVKLTLSALAKSGWKRKQEDKPDIGPDFIEDRPILSVFEEAVQIGWDAKGKNSTECMERYFLCPLGTEELFSHLDTVNVVDVL